MLASNAVHFSKMKLNDLFNNKDSWPPCYLSVVVGGGEGERRSLLQVPRRVEVGRGG